MGPPPRPRMSSSNDLTTQRFLTLWRSGSGGPRGTQSSWRKCHKKAKNDPARFDSNLPSGGNAYNRNLELSVGDFCPVSIRFRRYGAERQNSKREFWIRQFIREGGDEHVWGLS